LKKKLAIISSHPIQYNAPVFAMLSRSGKLDVKVFYTWSQGIENVSDRDFGKSIKWDIPLLEGYSYEVCENVSDRPGPGSFNGIVCPGLIPALKNWGAQALLVFGWNYRAHYSAMRYFKGRIPVFFRGDSTLLDEAGGIRPLIRRMLLRYIYRSADYAFYVGQNNRDYFLSHGFKPRALFFAPHAIDNDRFGAMNDSMRQEIAELRSSLNIKPGDKVVLFVGKFEPKKDPLLLIGAALKLNAPDVHFVFTGNGVLEEEMKRNASGSNNIHFLPFQNQSRMPLVYHMCDILALPSLGPGETWGLVVNEAMACGKAILASDKCGCSADLIRQGDNGFVMQAGSEDSCLRGLEQLLESPQNLIRQGEKSKEIISSWSFREVCRSFEENISNNS
jgi:glycosyltransferase involved in cell wall biosynthesis